MKKSIITVCILFFAVFTALGQSVTLEPTASNQISISAYGSQVPILNGYRTGGTANSPTAVTNGSSLLRLYGEGYSGVGHTPRFNAAITFTATQDFTTTANGTSILFWTTANSTSTAFPKMTIAENGNVGIGSFSNLTPHGKLSFDNTDNKRKVLLSSDANNEHQFSGFGTSNQTLRYQIPSSTNSHAFYVGTSSTTSSELMRITGTGNVGIGTDSPNGNLSFSNTNNNRKILLYEDANNENQFMGFGVNAQMLRYQIPSTANNHVFYAGTSSTTSSELMRITGTGRVGIGTNNPQTILEVKLPSNNYGLQHSDGTTTLATYVSASSGASLGTRTNHPLSFYVSSGGSKLSIATTGNVTVTDFTKLGSDAPAIKQKIITGFNTPAIQGASMVMAHGLNPAKILSVNIFVEATEGFTLLLYQTPPNYKGSSDMEYFYAVTPTNVELSLSSSDSARILSKPIRVFITYME